MSALAFEIRNNCAITGARTGTVTTPHGSFQTPAFMTVGTKGTVKGVLPGMVRDCGAEVVLNNTYHMLLRPGPDVVEAFGGAHAFMGWDGPILTDSGGYQAYSMADINAVNDEGVVFKSIVDGSRIRLGPEDSMRVQNQIGADIIMAMDDCPPALDPLAAPPNLIRTKLAGARPKHYDHARRLDEANERTIRWLERCERAHARKDEQALFGIVQGGTDLDRRTRSAEQVCGVDLPGYAIGGVAVGESSDDIHAVVRHTAPLLPSAKPRYLMGVGYPSDIVSAVCAGVDMFDCVLPTRNGRNANAFTPQGQIRLKNAKYELDTLPLLEGCDCPACRPGAFAWSGHFGSDRPWFTRGYIRHLFRAEEMLGPILVSLHNIRIFQRLMSDIRDTIATGDWAGFADAWPCARDGLPEPVRAKIGS